MPEESPEPVELTSQVLVMMLNLADSVRLRTCVGICLVNMLDMAGWKRLSCNSASCNDVVLRDCQSYQSVDLARMLRIDRCGKTRIALDAPKLCHKLACVSIIIHTIRYLLYTGQSLL